jgi:subtilisin family serine protease
MFFFLCVRLPRLLHSFSRIPTAVHSPLIPSSSARPTWYFVQFTSVPDHRLLNSQSIHLTNRYFISPLKYHLYLTGSQAVFLVDHKLAILEKVENKVRESELPVSSADFLRVETSEAFDPSGWSESFTKVSGTRYCVVTETPEVTAQALAEDPDVLAVWAGVRPKLHNRLAAGFTQKNTKILNSNGGFERVAEAKGINGSGVVVTVLDTYLDTNSTFFYDAAVSIANDTYTPNHRKVVYNFWHEEWEPEYGEHGTHVSGTIAGQARVGNSTAAQLNGVAPGARLAFRGWPISDDEFGVFGEILTDIMTTVDSTITSNSWGAAGTWPFEMFIGDEAVFNHSNRAFFFSAGNEGEGGYRTVGSPAQGKNIIAVGALDQLEVVNPPNTSDGEYLLQTRSFRRVATRAKLVAGPVLAFPEEAEGHSYRILFNAALSDENVSDRVVYVTNQSEIEQLARLNESAQPLVALANFSVIQVPLNFSVLQLQALSDEFWSVVYDNFNESQGIAFHREYRRNFSAEPNLAYFSSRGPAYSGLIKPDVVGPGTSLISARSVPDGLPDHDLNPLDAVIYQGTSMSCPSVAGGAALVTQILQEAGLSPSAALLYAAIIGIADPVPRGNPEPNLKFGFGIVNVSNIDRDNFVTADEVEIQGNEHLVGTTTIGGGSTELRIAISFLDIVTEYDGIVSLLNELALIVESPSGGLIRGNQHPGDGEEHFSTRQRVIVAEPETGTWTIHVIANLPEGISDTVKFAAIVIGDVDGDPLEFNHSDTCVGYGPGGTCKNGLWECNASRLGQNCQFDLETIEVGSRHNISIVSSGNAYFGLVKPSGPGILRVIAIITDEDSLEEYPMVHGFVRENGTAGAFPHDYDWPVLGLYNITYAFAPSPPEAEIAGLLLHNPHSWNATYIVWTEFLPLPSASPSASFASTPSPTSPSGLSKGAKIGLAVGGSILGVIIIAVIVVFLFQRRRRDAGDRQKLSESLQPSEKGGYVA